MRWIATLIAFAWIVTGCAKPPAAPAPTTPAIGVLVVRADVSETGHTELIRSHIQNITSVDFCRRYVRAIQATDPELSWLARFAKSSNPIEAAADDLVSKLQAITVSGKSEIRLELALEPATESAVVLGVVGDEYINWARGHQAAQLEKARDSYGLDLDEYEMHLAWINQNDGDLAWETYQKRRRELEGFLNEYRLLLATTEGMVAAVVAAPEWDEWVDDTVKRIQTARRSQERIEEQLQELGQRLGGINPPRDPQVIREQRRKLIEAIDGVDLSLCELESVANWPVRWSVRPQESD